ncbi:hypothetical protein A1Q1_07348 [Trichosporon asahii var. asahii CBS 2479]|uniref:RWD domain-containing protein n=1 Tax=Trichosporon asahii var. asahii (strain ATCC 90039 / CBS 2479 / JCM 2466 / KCTC 7840 / NBRC 103889/ NCYC 2677 / UAMH 7654) TaxID=1186058 RepID=J5TKM6_TRIAS|nr:hypothetical protein A1Q1_07348 [Trichosporon asahii var. asahii CBS 2479]EJT51376.1 hypothetical protein A1Q1_07348 [Trichosporon asahii var. asahii CBS 2479]
MADHEAILAEEFEVLESIFPDELEIVDNVVRIRVEPEEEVSGHPLTVTLVVSYPETYPDVIPDMGLEDIDEESGTLREGEADAVVEQLKQTAEESLGMAMTFTLATAAREALSAVLATRLRKEQEEDDARAAAYEEEEKAKTRGTPLTKDRYLSWRKTFLEELKKKRAKEEEEKVRAMGSKEREEYKKRRDRPSGEYTPSCQSTAMFWDQSHEATQSANKLTTTGRQLFETAKVSATSDEALYEDGEAVDMSKYTREERDAARWAEEGEGKAGIDLDESDDE